MRFRSIIISSFVALSSLCSCMEKDWDVETGYVVDLSISLPEGFSSSALQLLVYSPSDSSYLDRGFLTYREPVSDIINAQAGFLPGSYCLACHNFDVSDTFLRGEMSMSTLCFYTFQVDDAVKARCGKLGKDVYNTPDEVVFGVLDCINVAADGVKAPIELKTLVEHWTVDIPVDGFANVATAGILLYAQKTCSYPCNAEADVPFGLTWCQLSLDAGNGHITGSFNTFGAAPGSVEKASLVVTDKAGKPIVFDLEDGVMAKARAAESLVISTDASIIVPEPEGSREQDGGGFTPEVGEWNYQRADIYI